MNKTIKNDTHAVCETSSSVVRLMNDARWPWFIVLPKNSAATELHHLQEAQRTAFLADINSISETLQHHTGCQSVNIAMLGNVVNALHCHVVARDSGDPNWPGPIWSFETAIPYAENALPMALITTIRSALIDQFGIKRSDLQ